jgi:hypothetical protein
LVNIESIDDITAKNKVVNVQLTSRGYKLVGRRKLFK